MLGFWDSSSTLTPPGWAEGNDNGTQGLKMSFCLLWIPSLVRKHSDVQQVGIRFSYSDFGCSFLKKVLFQKTVNMPQGLEPKYARHLSGDGSSCSFLHSLRCSEPFLHQGGGKYALCTFCSFFCRFLFCSFGSFFF